MDKISLLLEKGGLSLDRLHSFCRVAEAGGLSNAAEGDPGKLSLYSRQIRELEEFFGVELKRRQGKAIVITEAGRRLAQLTRRHLVGLADFKDEAKNMAKRITIAAGNSILEWVLLPKLATLRDALPNVSMDFYSDRTRTIVAKLADMTIDIGLVREDAVTPPLKAERLFAVGYSLFLPRHSPAASHENLNAASLKFRLLQLLAGNFGRCCSRPRTRQSGQLKSRCPVLHLLKRRAQYEEGCAAQYCPILRLKIGGMGKSRRCRCRSSAANCAISAWRGTHAWPKSDLSCVPLCKQSSLRDGDSKRTAH
jgi:DNA-binding transcriptional LysR family regulator